MQSRLPRREPDRLRPPALERIKYRLWASPGFRRIILSMVTLAARIWRRMLFRTCFVAVTGSLGKTTAKETLRAILAESAPTMATLQNQNDRFGVPRTLLRARPWHRYAVIEVGVGGPGQMAARARLIRPHVALFLGIARTHSTAFANLDSHAAEKARLLDGLGGEGVCVGNADDPRIVAILGRWSGRTVRFGTSPACDLSAERVESAWPDRLRFQVRSREENLSVQTLLVGEHWVPSVLGAIAAAHALGIPLQRSAASAELVAPFPGRLQPVEFSNGAVVLRDDYNASWTALKAGITVLRSARAGRRILVLSDFSDFRGNRRARLRFLSDNLIDACEHCLLIGNEAEYGRRRLSEAGMGDDRITCCDSVRDAAALLRKMLSAGDLVLLKGRTTDHVTRVFFGLRGRVGCDRSRCRRTVLCDFCPDLGFMDGGEGSLRVLGGAR